MLLIHSARHCCLLAALLFFGAVPRSGGLIIVLLGAGLALLGWSIVISTCRLRSGPGEHLAGGVAVLAADWGTRTSDDRLILWLRLSVGHIACMRLPDSSLPDDVREHLRAAAARDMRGEALTLACPDGRSAVCLYAVPLWPADEAEPCGLDTAVLSLLVSLNGLRVFDTVRNYNRLAGLDELRKTRRLQAIARSPAVLSHVFLTPHQGYDWSGGRSHRWRQHDEETVAAVDEGRSLQPLLARLSGASKGVFRSGALSGNWPWLGLARPPAPAVA